jgi:hypothetical protein
LREPITSSANSKRPVVVCIFVLVAAAISAFGSHDPTLTLACGVVIALTVRLLWRLGEPPILLVAVGLQLSQVVTPLLRANFLGVPLQSLFDLGDLTSATWFALAAMLSLVVGIWCGQRGTRAHPAQLLRAEARVWSPYAAFVFCIATILLGAAFDVLGGLSAGLRQPCLAAGRVQWVGVFVLSCVCTAQGRGYKYLLFVVCLEVVRGFTGFFSDFKEVFLVVLMGIFAARPKLDVRSMIAGFAVFSAVLVLAAFWSAIKADYREFVSQGSNQQIVVVSFGERISFLTDRIQEVDLDMMSRGFDILVKRLGYIDFLSATMFNVPSLLPFQNGAQIGATVLHVLQPRLFFPDKPPLPSDSELVIKYVGDRFANTQSSSEGTSVSLGYLAELYIDFGPLGSLAGMFIFGLVFGRSYRFVCSSTSLPAIVAFGLGVILALPMIQFEASLTKIVGGFLTTLIVILVLKRFVVPTLMNFLTQQKIRPRRIPL